MKHRGTILTTSVILLFIAAAVMTRFLPLEANFSPIGAVALFAGAYFFRKWYAWVIPMVILLISDGIFHLEYLKGLRDYPGFYPDMPFVYLSFFVAVMIGWTLRSGVSVPRLVGASLAMSFSFFLVTNLGVWAAGGLYPPTFSGLLECYAMAIPFFRNTLVSDLLFTGVLFGVYHLVGLVFPSLRLSSAYAHI